MAREPAPTGFCAAFAGRGGVLESVEARRRGVVVAAARVDEAGVVEGELFVGGDAARRDEGERGYLRALRSELCGAQIRT